MSICRNRIFGLNFRSLPNRLSLAALAMVLLGCGGQSANNSAEEGTFSPTNLAFASNMEIVGAGASFPAPLYQAWFIDLNRRVPQLQINYQSIGSGAGKEQFIANTVDFAASDVAISDEDKGKVQRGTILLPMTAGSIVLAYNLPGIEGLQLPRAVYPDIFRGKITRWNDPAIAAANPNLTLPDQPIIVVHRADGSGTTGIFTKHLSAINNEWKDTIGQGTAVSWPTVGTFIGARGNEGVTAQIQQNQGSIGYVEFGFARNNKLPVAALENKAGTFVVPTPESGAAALANVELPENLRVFIEDPDGADSYPIVTYTWMLMYETNDNPEKAKALEVAIHYGLTEGQKISDSLGYIPLPDNVRQKVAAAADRISPDYTITLD